MAHGVSDYRSSPYSTVKPLKCDTQWDLKPVDLGGCLIAELLLAYFNMVSVPHNMVRLERMLDY